MLRQRKLRVTAYAVIAAGAATVSLVAHGTGVLDPLELATVDARFSVRGQQAQPRDVAVVAIDATTFTALKTQWPFRRSLHAKVMDRLKQDGAKVIAYDVQFSEERNPLLSPDENDVENGALFGAVKRDRPVVLSATEVDDRGATNILGGTAAQRAAGARVGNTALNADGRDVNRTLPFAIDGLASFAVVANELASGRSVSPSRFGLADRTAWIDYAGPPGTILTVPFSRVLAGTFPRGTFTGRTVVVGATAPSLQDLHATSTTSGSSLMSGPEIQANAIETVRRGLPLQSVPSWLAWVLIALMASLMPMLAMRLRFLWATLAAAAVALGYVVIAQVAFSAGWVVPVIVPLVGLALAALATSAAHALLSAAERVRTRDLFARFVPEAVVDDVLARTDSDLRLGGQRLDGTIMFCDLRGFTTFSENLPPARVIEVLNRYFTEMTEAIMDRGGTLVAYLGDGILAVFGAPLPQDDHADRALEAARDMISSRLERLNASLAAEGSGHTFRMGIGLHSGPVLSGNVGSPQRIEYAAIGDTTNTASRVEAMTKVEGEQLLLSGATRDRLQHEASRRGLREVGERAVRGRTAPITVWSVDDPGETAGEPPAPADARSGR